MNTDTVRNVYRIRVILEEETQMKHPEEGWIKMPAVERREILQIASEPIPSEEEGRMRYRLVRDALMVQEGKA